MDFKNLRLTVHEISPEYLTIIKKEWTSTDVFMLMYDFRECYKCYQLIIKRLFTLWNQIGSELEHNSK